jgi:phage terminase large subunit-like protein
MAQQKIIPIVPYLEKLFILPSGDLVRLAPHQKKILSHVFSPNEDGELKYKQFVYSAPKKSGKSAIGAMCMSWFGFSGIIPRNGELYSLANDLEQSTARSYKEFKRSIEQNDLLLAETKKSTDRVIELCNGTIIMPLANDFAGAAGSNPNFSLFDELWAFNSEKGRRLFEEMAVPPTRKNAMRVITTYAGWVGESVLLEDIYKKIVRPENKLDFGTYMNYELGVETELPCYTDGQTFIYWDHEPRMPWQNKEYYEFQMNEPGFRWSAFRRIHRNEWVESEEGLDMNEWDKCVEAAKEASYLTPLAEDKQRPLALGVDVSLVKDRTSVASCFKKQGRIWTGPRRWWQPSKEEPLNFETTVEAYILELQERFFISVCYYDPWQFESSAQRLREKGVNMVPYPQSQPNTIKMTEHLLDKLREIGIVICPDDDLRSEAMMVSVKEIPGRGRRFIKDIKTKKIDSIIALSMAALGCTISCPDFDSLGDQMIVLRLNRDSD